MRTPSSHRFARYPLWLIPFLVSAVARGQSSPPAPTVEPAAEVAAPAQHATEANATRPLRPVQLLSELMYCLERVPEQDRTPCLAGVRSVLSAGIGYQRCIWNIGVRDRASQCAGALHVPSPAGEAETLRHELLAQGESLLELLADPVRTSDVRAVRAAVSDLHAKAARSVAYERGQFTLISQGGVSLGSWQAGYNFFLSEVLKERRSSLTERGILRKNTPAAATVTGASAGAINALISGMEGCKSTATKTKDSLFYRVWVETLGLSRADGGGLFEPGGSDDTLALFSKEPLERAVQLAKAYGENTAFLPDCRFNLGFVTTHLVPAATPVHVDQTGRKVLVRAPRLTERFSFRVTLGDKRSPKIESLPEAPKADTSGVPDNVFYAHLGRGKQPSFDDVLAGVRASGAFPVAFPPVPLYYSVYDTCTGRYQPGKVQPILPADKTSTTQAALGDDTDQRCETKTGTWVPELFVDGGTLDNTPIRLAATINTWEQQPGPNPWLTDLVPDANTYVFINPGVLGWEPHTPTNEQLQTATTDSLLQTYLAFGGQLLSSGFDAQLLNTAEQLAFIRREAGDHSTPRMEVPRRNSAIAGEQLAHFMAFFEHDFRVYDFYVGMLDGLQHVRGRMGGLAPYTQRVLDRARGDWEFRCMQAYYDAREVLDARVTHRGPKAFQGRAELAACRDQAGTSEPLVASHDNFRALIAALHNYKSWTLTSEYRPKQELGRFLSELEAQQFVFRDTQKLGDGYDLSVSPRKFFRRLLQRAIEQLADKHGFPESSLFSDGGRLAADALVRRDFPSFSLSAGFAANGAELGAQKLLVAAPDLWGLRADMRVRGYRAGREPLNAERRIWTTMQEASLGLTNSLGILVLSPGLLDLELGGALGVYQVYSWSDGQTARRSSFFSVGAGLVLLQRIYFNLERQQDLEPWRNVGADYTASLLDSLWNSTRWTGSVGFRWLFSN